MNVVRELGKLIEEPYKDKVLTKDEMLELSWEVDYDLIFTDNGNKYIFFYEAYAEMILEYRQENVREGMGDVENMIANGMYELIKD